MSSGDGYRELISTKSFSPIRIAFALVFALLLTVDGVAATINTRGLNSSRTKTTRKVSETSHAKKRMTRLARTRRTRTGKARLVRTSVRTRRHYRERFYTSSFMDDVTEGDVITGEDLEHGRADVLRMLESQNIHVQSVREARFSLEDVFISVVEQARLQGKVAQEA